MTASGNMRRVWALAPLLAIVSGCVSAALEDAVPGARNTGSYPNLNIPPRAETERRIVSHCTLSTSLPTETSEGSST